MRTTKYRPAFGSDMLGAGQRSRGTKCSSAWSARIHRHMPLQAKVGHAKRPAPLSRKNSGGVDRPGSRGYTPTSGSESVTERAPGQV